MATILDHDSVTHSPKARRAFAEAAGRRDLHMRHDCRDHAAPCVLHGVAREDCDENCLEAARPDLFR